MSAYEIDGDDAPVSDACGVLQDSRFNLDRTYRAGDPDFRKLQQALKGRDLVTDRRGEGKNGRAAKARALHELSAQQYEFETKDGRNITVQKYVPGSCGISRLHAAASM